MNRLSPREKLLACVVLGVVFVLINLAAFSSIVKRHAELRADLASKQVELKSLKLMLSQVDSSTAHEAWLKQKQPKLTNREQARVALLDEVKAVAKSNDVMLENPAFGSIDSQPDYQSVTVQVETKSSLASLVGFLNGLQQPEHFIVCESANLQVDTGDATKMRGHFKIAKWYAP